MKAELGLVVFDHRLQIRPLRILQRLHGLKHLQGQTLPVPNPAQVPFIGVLGDANRGLGE